MTDAIQGDQIPKEEKPWANKLEPPFNRHLGFNVEQWRKGYVEIVADVMPEHCNASGLPHGGFIATLLDAATALCGVYTEDEKRIRKALTLSLNINFMGQANGTRLRAVGNVTAQGRKIYYSSAKVYDMEKTVLATAQGVFRYRSGSEI